MEQEKTAEEREEDEKWAASSHVWNLLMFVYLPDSPSTTLITCLSKCAVPYAYTSVWIESKTES